MGWTLDSFACRCKSAYIPNIGFLANLVKNSETQNSDTRFTVYVRWRRHVLQCAWSMQWFWRFLLCCTIWYKCSLSRECYCYCCWMESRTRLQENLHEKRNEEPSNQNIVHCQPCCQLRTFCIRHGFFSVQEKSSKKLIKLRKEEFVTSILWLVQLQENQFTRNNFCRLDDHPCLGDAWLFVIF